MLQAKMINKRQLIKKLLNWYQIDGRDLPWRLHPRSRPPLTFPDPYKVWLSEVMLQQTTVVMATKRYQTFIQSWPTIGDLSAASDSEVMAEWAGLGYYARARNLLKCARIIVNDFDGQFPTEFNQLKQLPGIGPYSAAAIASIAFDVSVAAVDGNVERVLARIFAIDDPFPKAKSQLHKLATELCPEKRPGDWLQALMDLGALICKPQNPKCEICPVSQLCKAKHLGLSSRLPIKPPRPIRRIERGEVYLGLRNDGAWLLEQRPTGGLLGGMLGWPGSGWANTPICSPPCSGNWHKIGEVQHLLTHIELQINVHMANLPLDATPERGFFVPKECFREENLPSLMRKAFWLVEKECVIRTEESS